MAVVFDGERVVGHVPAPHGSASTVAGRARACGDHLVEVRAETGVREKLLRECVALTTLTNRVQAEFVPVRVANGQPKLR